MGWIRGNDEGYMFYDGQHDNAWRDRCMRGGISHGYRGGRGIMRVLL